MQSDWCDEIDEMRTMRPKWWHENDAIKMMRWERCDQNDADWQKHFEIRSNLPERCIFNRTWRYETPNWMLLGLSLQGVRLELIQCPQWKKAFGTQSAQTKQGRRWQGSEKSSILNLLHGPDWMPGCGNATPKMVMLLCHCGFMELVAISPSEEFRTFATFCPSG